MHIMVVIKSFIALILVQNGQKYLINLRIAWIQIPIRSECRKYFAFSFDVKMYRNLTHKSLNIYWREKAKNLNPYSTIKVKFRRGVQLSLKQRSTFWVSFWEMFLSTLWERWRKFSRHYCIKSDLLPFFSGKI